MADEPQITMTVKELVALHGSVLADKIDTVGANVAKLSVKVDAIETRVEAVAAAQRVSTALTERADVVDQRQSRASWSRRDRTIAAIGVGSATLIGLANTLAFLIIGKKA